MNAVLVSVDTVDRREGCKRDYLYTLDQFSVLERPEKENRKGGGELQPPLWLDEG